MFWTASCHKCITQHHHCGEGLWASGTPSCGPLSCLGQEPSKWPVAYFLPQAPAFRQQYLNLSEEIEHQR